ncbi:MAG: RelA/SpoT family protein [Bacilli bacterium]
MTKQKKIYTIDDLMELAGNYITNQESLDKIRKAYDFADFHHKGQFRKSGEPYIIHPINVAIILTSIYADCDALCAGLLHDTIEDCDVEKKDLEEEFGKKVAFLVDGVSKLGRLNFSTENDYLVEYYKKIIVGMSEDVRVIIIKLADRLHNMRTLWALAPEKQKANARETLEILAPIADHLGIHKIKSELEDLSLRYLKPEVFYDIAEKLNNTKLERDKYVSEMMSEVSKILDLHNIKHEIKGRSKSIYSIYRKLDKGRKFSDIYDLLALRVFVNTEEECYQVLGLVHSKYKPIPNRFKDYVAMPKPNMYQSLHTTVFGIDGYLFEIQIRTYEMDEVAENGIASHWAYKEGKSADEVYKTTTEKKLQFFKEIIELNEEKMSTEEFITSVKDEVLNNNIYVFTPKGDVFELPKGATPIDFAYRVHTKVGETMVGALVNNSIVPLDYQLKNNDIVKINTSKTSNGPSKEWLNIAKCTQTKNKIKAFFTKSEKDINIERGKEAIEKELRKRKVPFHEFFTPENKTKIFNEIKVKDIEEMYLTIGNNKFSPNTITNIILKQDDTNQNKPKMYVKSDDADIIVEGIDKIKVNLANCCNPVPQDEIIGYITKGNGISVHRRNCHNVAMKNGRIIDVSWSDETTKKYIASIMIFTSTSENKVFDIIQKANSNNIGIDKINTISKGEGSQYELDCIVNNLEQLNRYISNLEKEPFIVKIERLIR